jgi:glucosylceramidase
MKQNVIGLISWIAFLAVSSRGVLASSPTNVQIYVTAKDTGQRLTCIGEAGLADRPLVTEKEEYIFVDPSKTFQSILGIGGALTDASAETFYKLPGNNRREFLNAYFDAQGGIGYTLGRTQIHSCDFSSESYTYVENGDKQLNSFNISHDLKYRVPFIKEVLSAVGTNRFTLFASPWSPPAWMKDNGDMLHGGRLKPEYDEAWARYYCKFIRAYEQEGIPIW